MLSVEFMAPSSIVTPESHHLGERSQPFAQLFGYLGIRV
jgi:hypothetical protein